MKIKWVEFENTQTGLKVERVNFFDDVTLLVGLSGAGKTVILNAVDYSLKLACNKRLELEPFCVTLCIESGEDIYQWTYDIRKADTGELVLDEKPEYQFSYERLTCNGKVLFERSSSRVEMLGYDKIPQPKKDESLISQYSEDELLRNLVAEMRKSYKIDTDLEVRGGIGSEGFSWLKSKVSKTFEETKDVDVDFDTFSHLPVPMKLYIAKKYFFELYMQIFDMVKELFMEIEDIDVVEDRRREAYWVSIQVYGKRLLQYDISSGMLKTIFYLVELCTMPSKSLVLIDEFENGLGVNCIDILAELMLEERNDLQYIITSHHPKIVNQISAKRWRIIDREISTIKNRDSDSYGIGASRHDAYFNLLNRWDAEGKI